MTPHINAKKGDFAKTVLMPGDPLRAKYIAENFLEDSKLVTDVRNMYGYTGKYKGKEISVMGSGMGIPSIGIYATELIKFYDVENLIRIGSCGAYSEKLKLYDIILAQGASTNSNYEITYDLRGKYSAICDFDLLYRAYEYSKKIGVIPYVGNILSSDIFYQEDFEDYKKWQKLGVLAVEMESYGLYCIANRLGAKALSILTVSDSLVTLEETTAEEREKSFTIMMEIALNL